MSIQHAALPDLLEARLAEPLPGAAAQRSFEADLAYGRHAGPAPSDARRAAVMILLYPHQGQWHVPLTLRPPGLANHAGQVCFPGGAAHAHEQSDAAALRELQEELAVEAGDVRLLGRLSELYLFNSNFLVTPWLGCCEKRPDFVPCPDEVAQLLEIPLAHLQDPANRAIHRQRQRAVSFSAPAFVCDGCQIWGATAMILAELLALVDSSE